MSLRAAQGILIAMPNPEAGRGWGGGLLTCDDRDLHALCLLSDPGNPLGN